MEKTKTKPDHKGMKQVAFSLLYLFLLFTTSKVLQIGLGASWSWGVVTSPLWVPAVILLVTFIVVKHQLRKANNGK